MKLRPVTHEELTSVQGGLLPGMCSPGVLIDLRIVFDTVIKAMKQLMP